MTDSLASSLTAGVTSYSNIILFAEASDKHYKALLSFVDGGGNLLIAVDASLSVQTRDFLNSCGVAVRPNATNLIDHASHTEVEYDR